MNQIQSVTIVGSGNLAEALARAMDRSDLDLVQIIARNRLRGEEVARMAHTVWRASVEEAPRTDIYIIAVSDRAVPEVAEGLSSVREAVVVHTAGSVPMESIPEQFARRGVFYPLQTFTRGREVDFGEIPVFIEGATPELQDELERFALRISRTVHFASGDMRRKIHLAGVLANNFTNEMYVLGEEVMGWAGLGFEVLKPIIRETAAKASEASSPVEVQTGPAVRHDRSTLERHNALMEEMGQQKMKNIYNQISQIIWETSKKI